MLGAIYIGLSGMDAYSKGLQTISNNVANLNTLGFKSTAVTFNDVFNAGGGGGLTYNSGPASGFGQGVRFGQSQIDFTQGDLRQSDNDLDMAVQGSGFLILLNGDKTYYVRTGQFVVDDEGYISDQTNKYHLAVLDASNHPVALNIDAKRISAPVATTTVTFANVLSSTNTTNPDGSSTVSNIVVYDSLGGKHVWTATIKPAGASSPGEWIVSVTDLGGLSVDTDPPTPPQTVPPTDPPPIGPRLKFNLDGSIDPEKSKITFVAQPTGTNPMSVVFDFSTNVKALSAGNTTSLSATANGNGTGNLTTVTIDENGQVKLTYSNAKTELEGYVALADFRDPQQLERVGNGLFQNKGAGQFRLLSSGSEGIGKIVTKQVEASNVDLSQQFGDLILIQRGFQASSQVVSVSNDMIQELFGIRGRG